MWPWIVMLRGELATVVCLAATWYLFNRVWHKPFWRLWIPGVLLGLAIEVMTEPLWTYSLCIYIWRDVSPFVILGWGVMFSWIVAFSDALQERLFASANASCWPVFLTRLMLDWAVGLPLILGNELLGLYGLKIWRYNSCLQWDIILPIINYPLEGILATLFFLLALPAAVRYWKGKELR